MTGAVVFVVGAGMVFTLVLGVLLALLLKFAFKRGNWVWLLIPALPITSLALVLAGFAFGPSYKHLHEGPDIPFGGSHSVTVSSQFGRSSLTRALATINTSQFKTELANYTAEPIPNFVFALDLEIPPKAEARHFVSICINPQVSVGSPTYNAIMYLFSKAVIQADPNPSDTPYSEPQKLK